MLTKILFLFIKNMCEFCQHGDQKIMQICFRLFFFLSLSGALNKICKNNCRFNSRHADFSAFLRYRGINSIFHINYANKTHARI